MLRLGSISAFDKGTFGSEVKSCADDAGNARYRVCMDQKDSYVGDILKELVKKHSVMGFPKELYVEKSKEKEVTDSEEEVEEKTEEDEDAGGRAGD